MTHDTGSCKSCDWCGVIEPESGMFNRKGRPTSLSETVLCPDCAPNDDVERGLFIVFQFTMDEIENHVGEAMKNYFEPIHAEVEWIGLKYTGLEASMEGHVRCKVMLTFRDGLSHHSVDDIVGVKRIIDSANGDPERNNCRAKFYNWNIAEKLKEMGDPEVFTIGINRSE